jgi:hypothetical protein
MIHAAVLSGLITLAATLQDGVTFKDKQGNMSMRGLTSWVLKRIDDDTISFEGSGAPFVGKWRDQGLEFTGRTIKGTATKNAAGAYRLTQATISGAVVGVVREDAKKQTLTIRTESCSYDGKSDMATLPNAFSLRFDDGANDQVLTVTGKRGSIGLAPWGEKDQYPIRTLEVAGPVEMSLGGNRLQQSSQQRVPFRVFTKASKVTYVDATRTFTLAGPVEIDGEDDLVSGTVGANSAIIKLNAERKPVEISLSGSPGRTSLRQPPPRTGS